MTTQIKFKLLPGGRMPERAHPTDACFDVFALSRDIQEGYVSYGLGFQTEIPEDWAGYFYPRSSISKYDLVLCNSVAVIDAGYRGEWQARFKLIGRTNAGTSATWHNPYSSFANVPRLYNVGGRIGQIRFAPLPLYELVEVEELNDTERGTGGFGSTGTV